MKTALVTGGTKGIGLATCSRLAEDGVKVIACSRQQPKNFPFDWVYYDAFGNGPAPSIDADILVNNVGGGGRWGADFTNTEFLTYLEVMEKNSWAAVKMTKQSVSHMVKQGWGRVVSVASIYGKESGGKPWFNMAKAAEISFMKALSKDKSLVQRNITFNTVCPGHIHVEGKPDEENLDRFPLGRMGRADEIANVVAFLCSDEASLVNGACIPVDGGESHSF